MNEKRIAYMILAHKLPQQVNHLIERLDCDGVDFYLHVDKKSDIIKEINLKENLHIVQQRVDVKWGHISEIEATLELMKCVKNSSYTYDYVWLISGQDYPIKSNAYIKNFFLENYGSNFIEVIPKYDERYLRYLKRNQTWYPIWGASPKFIVRVLRKIYNYMTGGMKHTIIKRKNILGVEWFFGSQWFAITYEAMLYILEEAYAKPYLKYYKNCICSDESFFQTILGNSEYADTIKDYITYVDWSEGKKNPKILTEEDYERLKSSDKLIARKFENVNDKIKYLSE